MSSICVDIVSDRMVKDETEIQTYREVDKRSLFVGLTLTPVILLILILPWLLFSETPPWWITAFCLVWGTVLAFFPLSAFKRYLISRLATSWLVGWSEKGIWCRFRRPCIGGSSSAVGSFAFIPTDNIDWVRVLDKTQELTIDVGLQNNGKKLKYLEVGLKKLDVSALREALKTERIRQQNHISFQGALLELSDEGTLLTAIENPESIAKQLPSCFQVLENKVTRGKKFEDMSGDEMYRYIKTIVENGDRMAAIRATCDGFKCTFTEANRFVDALIAGQDNVPHPLGAKGR